MTQKTIFIFGIINFAILVGILARGLKGVARNFFYARRVAIKKNVIASAQMLKSAKQRFSKSSLSVANLQKDISAQHAAVMERSSWECAEIIKSANSKAAGLADSAMRQAEEAKNAAVSQIKSGLLDIAFGRAARLLAGALTGEAKKKIAERGFREVSELVQSSPRYDTLFSTKNPLSLDGRGLGRG